MKNLLLIFVPVLLLGCNAQDDDSSQVNESSQIEQTVYQWASVQKGGTPQRNVVKTSDEYWQTVTGRELKKGVAVYLTTDDNLIRVAPKASYDHGQVFKAKGIDIDQLELLNNNAKTKYDLTATASQSVMQQAGFDDGSVALKGLTNGDNAILKTRQALSDDDVYLIHVKEKNSPHLLTIKSGFEKSNQAQRLPVELSVGNKALLKDEITLSLISPVSEQVNVQYNAGTAEFSQPLEQLGAINGFYEIEARVMTEIKGKKVMRSVKVPFTNVTTTALLGAPKYQTNANKVVVNLPIEAEMPGRFAIKATLASKNGDVVTQLATVEVAAQIDSFEQLSLPFDIATAPKGELFLMNVELTDQTRMMKTYPKL